MNENISWIIHHTSPALRLRLLLLGGVSCRPKLSFIDDYCNVFIKRRERAVYCPIIAELIYELD
jgi:hypothetical protein